MPSVNGNLFAEAGSTEDILSIGAVSFFASLSSHQLPKDGVIG